jgi:hypothetical protein
MYKRISHNIVEEHFDHPMAIDLKDKLSNPMDPTPPKMKSSKSGMWMSTNNDISTLVGHIRNYIVSEIVEGGELFKRLQLLESFTED